MSRASNWISGAVIAAGAAIASVAAAQGAVESVTPVDGPSVYRAVGLGASAAFAIGMSVLGAAYAVGRIGSAALGAATEKPELLTRSILFVALAEGLAVLGFAIAMMLLQKI